MVLPDKIRTVSRLVCLIALSVEIQKRFELHMGGGKKCSQQLCSPSFVPCFRLLLIKVLPKLKLTFLLQWCISQCSHMFGCYILSHSSPLSENKFTNPTKTNCTSFTVSPDYINPISTPHMTPFWHGQHALAFHHSSCSYFHHSYEIVQGIFFLLSYIRSNSCTLDIHT